MRKFKIIFAVISTILLLAIVPLTQAFDYSGPGKDITFAWDANIEADLAGYRIYWASESGGHIFVKDGGTSTSTYTEVKLGDAGFDPANPTLTVPVQVDGDYYWVATAFDTRNNESGPSNEVSTQIDNPPLPPSGLHQTAVTASLEFKLHWSKQYKTVKLSNVTTANLRTK